MNGTEPLLSATTSSPAETQRLASALAGVLVDGDLLVLSGDLGAGKTCFAKGLAAGLGIDRPVTSPTFTLANRYVGRLVLNHLDVYRLDDPAEAESLGLAELLEEGVTAIEWGERIGGLLPDDRLEVTIRYPDPVHDRAHDPTYGSVHGVAGGAASGWEFEGPTERIVELWAPPGSSWGGRALPSSLEVQVGR